MLSQRAASRVKTSPLSNYPNADASLPGVGRITDDAREKE
jgi:hypothetical protein